MDILSGLLMFAMIALYTSQNFFCKKFSLGYPGDESNTTPVFTIVGGTVVALVSFMFAEFSFSAKPMTVVFGLITAVALYGYNYFILKSSGCGPYSVLMVFSIAGGIVMPTVVKWVFFGESLSVIALLLLVIMFYSVYLMSLKPSSQDEGKGTNRVTTKFILLCLGLGICNGAYATLLAVQQEITGSDEKEELIIVTFLCAAIVSLVSLLVRKVNIKGAMRQTKKSALYLLVYSLSAALAVNSLVIVMLFDINTSALYTVQNAGVMLMSVLLSCVCFKEKLTKVNLIGCILMAISLVGIMIF